MATVISSKTSGGGGASITGDSSGILQLASADGTTAVTIDASQNVSFAKGFTVGATASPAFSAYQSSAQTLSSATATKIQFQTEEFDTASAFDSTTNYRFTPQVAGYYQVYGSVQSGGTPATAQTFIYKNGSVYKSGSFINTATSFVTANIGAIMYLNGSTDYIEFYGAISVGQALVNGSTNGTYFSACLARSA
jgi:hypothetical protein